MLVAAAASGCAIPYTGSNDDARTIHAGWTMADSLASLKPDPNNARRHTPRNVGMIESALREIGAARSIVIDETNTVLAGNATIEAAAAAGIERVQIVDADGETIIAVRRSGLTDEQKTKLALYDNRAAELAGWDAEVLAQLADDGADLSAFWFEDELALILDRPNDDDWASAFGALPDGEKSPFQQMTFTVSDEQAKHVNAALAAAKAMGAFVDTGNENSNGNALARICETFLTVGVR